LTWSEDGDGDGLGGDFAAATAAAARAKAQQQRDRAEAIRRAREEEGAAEQRRAAALLVTRPGLGGAAVAMAHGTDRFPVSGGEGDAAGLGDVLSLSPRWAVAKARSGLGAVAMAAGGERFADALAAVAALRGPEGGAMADVDAALQEAWITLQGDAEDREPTVAEITGAAGGGAAGAAVRGAALKWARDGDRLDLETLPDADRKRREASAQVAALGAEWSRAPGRWPEAPPGPSEAAGGRNSQGEAAEAAAAAAARSGVNYETMLGRPAVEAAQLEAAEAFVRAQAGREGSYLVDSPLQRRGAKVVRMSDQWRRAAGVSPGSSQSASTSNLVIDLLGPRSPPREQLLRLSPHPSAVEPQRRGAVLRPKANAAAVAAELYPPAAASSLSLSLSPYLLSPDTDTAVSEARSPADAYRLSPAPTSPSPASASPGPPSVAPSTSSTTHAAAVLKALAARRAAKLVGADSAEAPSAPGFMGGVAEALLATRRAARGSQPLSPRGEGRSTPAGAAGEGPGSAAGSDRGDADWFSTWAK
jgi:hypothetical protein